MKRLNKIFEKLAKFLNLARLGLLIPLILLVNCTLFQSDDRQCLAEAQCIPEVGTAVFSTMVCEHDNKAMIFASREWQVLPIEDESTSVAIHEDDKSNRTIILVYAATDQPAETHYCLFNTLQDLDSIDDELFSGLINAAQATWSDKGLDAE